MRTGSLLVALAFALVSAAQASAQVRRDELMLVRDATEREQAGDFAGARRILENILAANPQSLSGLLSLERVLRMQGRLEDLIPYVRRHLQADETSAIGHQMLVRAFSSLDQVPELERAGDAWIRAVPKVETPYREIARVWQQRRDYTRALQYLEAGRSRIGRADALALELGELYALLEETGRAVREWERAIGPQARGLMLVQRRLTMLPDGGAQLLPRLVDALARPPALLPRQRAGALLAIDAGLEDRAESIVRAAAGSLQGDERQSFLIEMARRADAAQLNRVAYWAYSQLALDDVAPRQGLAIRARVAELALALGDTASAARSYQQLERSLAVGSPERRQAVALRIQLTVKEGKLEQAQQELQMFRQEYPDAPELDGVAAVLANAHLDADNLDAADEALVGIVGPRSGLARGRIALRRGDVAVAKTALLTSAHSLRGAEATETIRLVTLLGKVSKAGGELLGQALARASAGGGKAAVTMLEQGVAQLPESERAAVLDFAAALADRAELPLDAERVRRRIIEEYEKSHEAPGALLALARALGERNDATEEARQYLEKLIIEYPRSALVPQARQELDRLQGRVPRS